MAPDPIVLDSLLVRAGRITIRGRITDATDPDRIPFAQVTVLPGFPTVGAVSGRFTIRGVPVGRAVTVLVESVGYYPAPIALITEADTTLYVALEPDSVGMRMLAQQAEKLSVRSRSVPYALQSLDREELDRRPGWTAFDIVNSRLRMMGRRGRTLSPNGQHYCLFVDDVNRRFPAFLFGFNADEVERIEIYDRGGMIRVYTRRYLISLMGREPPTVVYIKGGMGRPVCR
jgi:hypothetical protein